MNNQSRYAYYRTLEHGFELTFLCPPELALGRPKRVAEILHIVKREIVSWNPQTLDKTENTLRATFLENLDGQPQELVHAIDSRLSRYAKQTLYPKEVEDILGITRKELTRWGKDGRLRRSGTGKFKQGNQIFQFFKHPVAAIAALYFHPEIIQGWRAEDAESGKSSRA